MPQVQSVANAMAAKESRVKISLTHWPILYLKPVFLANFGICTIECKCTKLDVLIRAKILILGFRKGTGRERLGLLAIVQLLEFAIPLLSITKQCINSPFNVILKHVQLDVF